MFVMRLFPTCLAGLLALQRGLAASDLPLSPADQLRTFKLPKGFIIELVASEPELPKPITVTWDDSGRMWTMTAVEYPVDANESPAQAQSLYSTPGRDRVLVFDPPRTNRPGAAVLGKPRVFADGLAIPLGLLPYRDGAFVHHGTEVVLLRDTDGDGRADGREVILSGFGVQDSHLMPHQFTFAPGGWMYLAQGAFNYSRVRTRDGVVVRYDQTKLGRFRPDGSAFEILTHGPCNIWGLVITRFGETWIQEANDYGYPTMRFQPGANYPGCGDTKFRSYAPMQPSIASAPMGGTGLSGLAMCEDTEGFPPEWRDLMFVANPITRQVQTLRIVRGENGERLEKLAEFVTSSDEMFRPIAIHFGPDACLYIVDWYNKIISHNEVPRNHPDRDKTRGRVWRVRHESQKLREIPDVAKAGDSDLLKHLSSGNKWEWNAALHQMAERQPAGLAAGLAAMARRPEGMLQAHTHTGGASSMALEAAALQIRALWALESLGRVDRSLLAELLGNPDQNVRREAVRVAGAQLNSQDALALVSSLATDTDHHVRTEVIRVVSGQDAPWKHHIVSGAEKRPDRPLNSAAAGVLIGMAKPPLPNPNRAWPGYEREFERYLIRAALERHAAAVAGFLESPRAETLPADNRRLACSVLEPPMAARHLARIFSQSSFEPTDEEWLILHRHRRMPEVSRAFMMFNMYPQHRILSAALRRRDLIDPAADRDWLTETANGLLRGDYNDDAEEVQRNALDAVRVWRLDGAADGVIFLLGHANNATLQLGALRALRELQAGPPDLLHGFATNAGHAAALRSEAVAALAVNRSAEAQPRLLSLWPTLTEAQRRPLIEQMSANRTGATMLLAAIDSRTLGMEDLPVSALERMRTLLAGNAAMEALWRDASNRMKRALRFNGGRDDYISAKLALDGPFTVEAWVRLHGEISNHDGILGTAGRHPAALDMNFAGAQFRVWLGSGEGDVVIAKRKTVADVWTHYAVTRDSRGEFRIYINGELDAAGREASSGSYSNLDVARTVPQNGGTDGWIAEYRVWSVARTPEEILASFDRSFAGEKLPATLKHYFAAERADDSETGFVTPAKLRGAARIEGTLETPPLLTVSESRTLDEKLLKFRALAEAGGDAARGKEIFATSCLVCHQAGGQGAAFAPNLDGSGLRGTDALLRALITPNAAMEAGYRKFRVETSDGEIHEGFLAQRDAAGVVLRQPNAEPLRISAQDIKRAGFQNVSLMPEGLLEALPPRQVSDLFAYLRALK